MPGYEKRYYKQEGLADHGVRKYDYNLGQFTSIDPLWEKQYGWTPYHYCGNNPVMAVDPSGLEDGTGFEIFYRSLVEAGIEDEYNEAVAKYAPGALMIGVGLLGTATGIGSTIGAPLTAWGAAILGFDLTCSIYSISAGTAKTVSTIAGEEETANSIPGSYLGMIGKGVDATAGTGKTFETIFDLTSSGVDITRNIINCFTNPFEFIPLASNTGGLLFPYASSSTQAKVPHKRKTDNQNIVKDGFDFLKYIDSFSNEN